MEKTEIAGRKKAFFAELIKLFILAAAFGYIEGTAAHYLRLIYYPEGFSDTIKPILYKTALIEMGREAATLIVLISAAILTEGPSIRRFANFIFLFSVWDIVYYLALYLFEGWPKSLFTGDILFLIPKAWIAPVLAPVVISVIGITGYFVCQWTFIRNGRIKLGVLPAALLAAALALWLFTFLQADITNLKMNQPYNWPLFIAAVLSSLAGLFLLDRQNRE